MDAYVAFMFCTPQELRSYGREVGDALKAMSAGRMKYMESSPGMAAVAFITDHSRREVHKAMSDLWRKEQRTWVLPLDLDNPAAIIDRVLMDWVRKQLGR